jgi:hypothetical protein
MVDRFQELLVKLRERFPNINRIVINADKGPESSVQRTQWLQRLVALSDKTTIFCALRFSFRLVTGPSVLG